MQIVIDISENTYKVFKQLNSIIGFLVYEKDILTLITAVKNGTPLPKGHGRLIDADACKKNKKDFCEKSTRTNWYDIIDDFLDDALTIIEADKGE